MKPQRLVLDQRISTSRLRRPFPFAEPAAHVTRFFERVGGMSSIFVGNICNQRCIYCDTPREPVTSLTPEDARARVDRMAELGIRRLMFVGGEPTIWRDLPALIGHARARGIPDVFIATNGLMLSYERYLRRLLDAGLTGLELSFDDFDAATQRTLSANDQADVLLDQAVEHLLPHRDLFLFFLAVVTRVNRRHLPAYLDRLAALGARRGAPIPAIFTHLKPITFAYENRDLLVEPIGAAAAAIVAAVRLGLERGLPIIHKELPPCQTPGYEAYAWEANLVEYCVDLGAAELASVQSPMLAKGPRCGECCHDDICVGVYRNYVDQFGWGEFHPVTRPSPGER
ncbi:MAG: radical SAM protein [Deltaproteobacteria bacterium]|nr:radical SAM protein [Deltaproteobacteria bacterium]